MKLLLITSPRLLKRSKTLRSVMLCVGLVCIGTAFPSCGKLYLRVMGVEPFRTVSDNEAKHFLMKQGVHDTLCYEACADAYIGLLKRKRYDTLIYQYPDWWLQNHVQPIQTMCFDNRTKKPVFAFFNCIAETRGLARFTWNKNHELDVFPPQEYTSYKWIDTLITFEELTLTLQTFAHEPLVLNTAEKPYTVLVFYALCVEKQAVNLIRETQTYLDTYLPNQCKVYYVNFDNTLYALSK